MELSYWLRVSRRRGETPIWSILQAEGPAIPEDPWLPDDEPAPEGCSVLPPLLDGLLVSMEPTHPTSAPARMKTLRIPRATRRRVESKCIQIASREPAV